MLPSLTGKVALLKVEPKHLPRRQRPRQVDLERVQESSFVNFGMVFIPVLENLSKNQLPILTKLIKLEPNSISNNTKLDL